MAKLITAIFKTRAKALQAVEDLIGHAFPEEDISLLMSDRSRGREFVMTEATKAPEGMAIGAAIGGLIGATVLALNSAGLVAIPGMNVIAFAMGASAERPGGGGGAYRKEGTSQSGSFLPYNPDDATNGSMVNPDSLYQDPIGGGLGGLPDPLGVLGGLLPGGGGITGSINVGGVNITGSIGPGF